MKQPSHREGGGGGGGHVSNAILALVLTPLLNNPAQLHTVVHNVRPTEVFVNYRVWP